MSCISRRIPRALVALCVVFLTGCPDLPKECGENVDRVVSIDFSGPGTIETTPDYDTAFYDVTITITKKDREKPAKVCYAVRDEDPWYKFFWAVDDVLDANIMGFPAGQTSRTIEGTFGLWAKDNDEVCGIGALPGDAQVKGCSGESDAEIYLDPQGSDGPDSPIHNVKLD